MEVSYQPRILWATPESKNGSPKKIATLPKIRQNPKK